MILIKIRWICSKLEKPGICKDRERLYQKMNPNSHAQSLAEAVYTPNQDLTYGPLITFYDD